MLKKGLWIIVIVSILFILFWKFIRHDSNPIQSQTRFLMDTYCTIQVPGDVDVIPAIEKAFVKIEEIDVKFNTLNPESPVYAFNNFNVPIEDEEIIALVQTALQVSQKSDGKFDITIFPLIELWGFFTDSPKLPYREKIEEILKTVGYKDIIVENGKIMKKNVGTKIDFGSIAKGYAIGEAKKALVEAGIKSALIDAGGDIYALGTNNGKPWIIGIRNPRGDGVVGALELSDVAVITSGDYERVFEEGG